MSEKVLKVVIFGPPAGGKGTQCEFIKKELGLFHLSTGDVLREHVKNDTELGRKAKSWMDAGKLVPDELVMDIVKERLTRDDAKKSGWILDGVPRTPNQAEYIIKEDLIPDAIICMKVPSEECIKRSIGRRIDPITDKIYHIEFYPPEDEEVKKRLIHRKDDTLEAVKMRLATYEKYLSTLDHFKGKCRIVDIDGTRGKQASWKDISKVLNEILKE